MSEVHRSPTPAAAIALLVDKEAVREVIACYARAADRCDFELMRSCFWDDALDVHGFMIATPDELVDVLAVPTDVTKEDQVRELADAPVARFGAVHIVCLNAGVSVGGSTWELSDADFRWTFDVDFFGVVHGIRAFLPLLIAHGEGHVLGIASNTAVATVKGIAPYVASKHAVLALGETLLQDRKSEYGEANVPAERVAASQAFLDEHGTAPDEVAEQIVQPFLDGDAFYLFTDDRDLEMLDARAEGIHDGHLAPPATPGVYPAALH